MIGYVKASRIAQGNEKGDKKVIDSEGRRCGVGLDSDLVGVQFAYRRLRYWDWTHFSKSDTWKGYVSRWMDSCDQMRDKTK